MAPEETIKPLLEPQLVAAIGASRGGWGCRDSRDW